jgi:hypothetical protein
MYGESKTVAIATNVCLGENEMGVIQIVAILLVFALVWWLFSTYVLPHVSEPFKTIIIIVLVVAVCLWLLSLVGVLGPIPWR